MNLIVGVNGWMFVTCTLSNRRALYSRWHEELLAHLLVLEWHSTQCKLSPSIYYVYCTMCGKSMRCGLMLAFDVNFGI